MVCLQLYLYPNNHPFMLLMLLMSRPGLDHPEEDFSARLQEAVGAAVPGPEPAPGVRQGDAREIRRPRPRHRPGPRSKRTSPWVDKRFSVIQEEAETGSRETLLE